MGGGLPGPLPRGHHGLTREFIAHNQRERLMAALAEVVAERGYPATTVAGVTKAAGVSRRAFYEHFESKRDCFLATLEIAIEELSRQVAGAVEAESDWALRVRAAIRAGLRFLAAEPELARLIVIESANAGPEAAVRYRSLLERLQAQLRDRREHAVPDGTDEVVVGGAASILASAINRGEGAELDRLAPDLVAFVLTPYLGALRAEALAREG